MNYNHSKVKPKHGDIIKHRSSGDHHDSYMLYFECLGEGKLHRLTHSTCEQGGLHKNAKLVANIFDLYTGKEHLIDSIVKMLKDEARNDT